MKRALLALLVIALGGCAVFAAIAWHPAIAPIGKPEHDTKLIAHGADLAALGDCATCHTAHRSQPYAGGYRLQTPFGAIYTSNITPDLETGIGAWSLAAFTRAMRQGVDREGSNLYPAFPYDHFTRVNDDDIAALYAFFMSRKPINATRPDNELPFPLNWRPVLAGWKLLYLDDNRHQPDPTRDALWNRGAYLVEGLGHCGACHTPRNSLGAEAKGKDLQGGEAEGWQAPPLAGAPWSEASLYAYLRSGLANDHGAAAGPMLPVTTNLAYVPDEDVRAMAAYLATKAGPARAMPAENVNAMAESQGAVIFSGACTSCHGPASPMTSNGAPALTLSSAIQSDDPGNTLRIILEGIKPQASRAGPLMPRFSTMLNNAQVVELAAYVRARFAPDKKPWMGLVETVRQIRSPGGKS